MKKAKTRAELEAMVSVQTEALLILIGKVDFLHNAVSELQEKVLAFEGKNLKAGLRCGELPHEDKIVDAFDEIGADNFVYKDDVWESGEDLYYALSRSLEYGGADQLEWVESVLWKLGFYWVHE